MNRSYKKKILWLSMLFACLAIFSAAHNCKQNAEPLKQWDWDHINLDSVTFPENFLWGCGINEYQVSGATNCPNNHWAAWEKKQKLPPSGISCNHWNNHANDIILLKNLGVNSCRFSVDWSLIEPLEGQFSQEAITHYKDWCNKLLAANIQPIVTLYHGTHPIWFEAKGAFEKEENINYFTRFTQKIFDALSDKVSLWFTINEPSMQAFEGCILGICPPGKFLAFNQAAKTLKNMLLAHVAVYNTLKSLPNGRTTKIGIIHTIMQFRSYYDWNFIFASLATLLNKLINDSVLDFFITGNFNLVMLGGLVNEHYPCPAAINSNDIIGLNYYSNLTLSLSSACHPNHIKTDMPYGLYAEGLYNAIKKISTLQRPIYITENGVADEKDTIRELWLKRHLFALSKAIADGYDVRGYFYWCLMDNYEWSFGYTKKFGLYQVDFTTQERSLRDSAHYFMHVCKQESRNSSQ